MILDVILRIAAKLFIPFILVTPENAADFQ